MGKIDWFAIFSGLDVDDIMQLFTTKCINIFSQYIPNKIVTCKERDPPWMTATLISAIKCKYSVYNRYVKHGQKPDDCVRSITRLLLKFAHPKINISLT